MEVLRFILLDEDERTSLDIDVAGPYSTINYHDFCMAAKKAGLEVNPEDNTTAEHIEWISALRLCLAPPETETEIVLWQGQNMVVKTVAPEDLVASKLIRMFLKHFCGILQKNSVCRFQ